MDSFQLRQISRSLVNSLTKSDCQSVFLRAIKGTLQNAQDGELPLFAWTLGLQQVELVQMLQICFPEIDVLERLSDRQYQQLLKTTPDDFLLLKDLLLDRRSPDQDMREVDWLARAIAAASQGSRHLWQDLGLHNRDEVSLLLQQYFEPLYLRNTKNVKWKRFLYAELGLAQGKSELQPPKCRVCPEFAICFAHSGHH